MFLKEVGELEPDEITAVEINPPEAHFYKEGIPEFVNEEWRQTWVYTQLSGIEARRSVYGDPAEQIEFITENGLEAWQAKVADIKTRYPK